ncbi:MAG: hypothetical protein KIT70_09115 [Anaerolineales bacterium]|nr:MAG: hypothetical protein KIT70_09115 [Anaerolineales bacterium]
MKELFNSLNDWQEQEKKRFLSLSIQKDHEVFSCIALTNPTEMIIVDGSAYEGAKVDRYTNALRVKEG